MPPRRPALALLAGQLHEDAVVQHLDRELVAVRGRGHEGDGTVWRRAARNRPGLATADGLTLEGDAFVPSAPWAAAVVAHPHPLVRRRPAEQCRGGPVPSPPATPAWPPSASTSGASGARRASTTTAETERLDVVAALDVAAPLAGDGPVARWPATRSAPLVALDGRRPAPRRRGSRSRPRCAVARADAAGRRPTPGPSCCSCPSTTSSRRPPSRPRRAAGWRSTTIETVPMADHFLAGATSKVADRAVTYLRELAVARPRGSLRLDHARSIAPRSRPRSCPRPRPGRRAQRSRPRTEARTPGHATELRADGARRAAAMAALASATVCSPKWKIDAASTASAPPSSTPSTRWSSVPDARRWRSPARPRRRRPPASARGRSRRGCRRGPST